VGPKVGLEVFEKRNKLSLQDNDPRSLGRQTRILVIIPTEPPAKIKALRSFDPSVTTSLWPEQCNSSEDLQLRLHRCDSDQPPNSARCSHSYWTVNSQGRVHATACLISGNKEEVTIKFDNGRLH